MKRIFSLFLSLVLISSMMLSSIVVEALPGTGSTKLVEVQYDITGRELHIGNGANTSNTLSIVEENGDKTATTFSHRNQPASKGHIVATIASDGIDEENDVIRIDNYDNGNTDSSPYHQINMSEPVTNGKAIISGKFYLSGTLASKNMRLKSTTTFGSKTYLEAPLDTKFNISLSSGEWYEFSYVADMDLEKPTITATYIPVNGGESLTGTTNFYSGAVMAESFTGITFYFKPDNGDYMMYDDIKVIHDTGYEKAKITTVGSDGKTDGGVPVIDHSQNKIQFTLDKEIIGLSDAHIRVESASSVNSAADINVRSDGANWIVTATLTENLDPWTNYKLIVGKEAYAGYKEVSGTSYVDVTDISENFKTPSAPLDARAEIDHNTGNATFDLASTSASTDMTVVYTHKDASGSMKGITTATYTVDNQTLEDKEIALEAPFNEGDVVKLFIIKSWSNPVPLFGKFYSMDSYGIVPDPVVPEDADVASTGIVLEENAYNNKKLTVKLKSYDDATTNDGAIYVYKKGGSIPTDLVYADFVTTANDGTLTTEISFDKIALSSGEYTVAFYTDGKAPITADFRIITDDYNKLTSIVSVGADGSNVVASGVNTFAFELDKAMPNLTEDYIYVTKSDGSPVNQATSVTSDGGKLIVTLEETLDPWANYFLVIDSAYYKAFESDVISNYLIDIPDAAMQFRTPSAPVDLRVNNINDADGKIDYDVVASDATPMVFIATNTGADGIIKEIKSDADTISSEESRDITLGSLASGDKAKFFVINSWDNPVPLFNKSYVKPYGAGISAVLEGAPSDKAKANEMVIDSFDYDNKAVTIHLNAGKDTSGVLYIYKRGEGLQATLEYVDYLVTASDGTLTYTAKLRSDINDADGEYTVAFYSHDVAKIENGFAIYDTESMAAADLGTIEFDMTGEDATVSYRVITKDKDGKDIEAPYSYYPGYLGNTAYFFRMANATAVGTTVLSSGETVAVQRANKSGNTEPNPSTYGNIYLSNQNASNPAAKTSGKYVITGSVYVSSDGYTKANATFDRNGTYNKVVPIWSNPLTKHTWYDFEIVVDMDAETGDNIFTKLIASDGSVLETNSARFAGPQVGSFRLDIATTEKLHSNFIAYKNLRLISFTGAEKPVIRYIDADKDDILSSGEKNITFKLSEDIGFTKDNIRVIDDNGNIIGTSKIVSSKMDIGDLLATVELEKALSSNMNYTLSIDPVTYEDYAEYVGGQYVNTLNIERAFTTHKANFDMYDVNFTSGTVTGKIDNANTTEVANVNLIYTVCSSDGVMKDVDTSVKRVIGAGATASSVSATQTAVSGDTLKLFAVESLNNPVPLFGKYWTENYDGTKPVPEFPQSTQKAQANTISFDTYDFDTNFDHTNKRIVVNLNTGKNAPVSGILYIYNDSYALSDGNFIYADYITTASNGTWAKEIKFDSSITNTTAGYKVAFYSDEIASAITNGFSVYSTANDDFLNYKRNKILEYSKAATTFAGLKQAITGTDDNGNTILESWSIFSTDADVSVYNTLTNKNAVYEELFKIVKNQPTYNALCTEFARIAGEKKQTEGTTTVVPPANDTANPGTPNVSMTVTPSGNAGSTAGGSVGGSAGGAVSGGASIFTDMSGHWAQKHAEALVNMGVVNGYADGSFRGDNPITRAELTKIIVEALDIPDGDGKAFYDVASSSWYAHYVSKAAASGVINGFEDGSFGPERYVTRQDAVLMIYRAMCLTKELPVGYKFFADEKDIQDYASDAIRCLADLGIINGSGDSMFLPKNNITRAEMAAVICRSLDYLQSHLQ